MAAEAHPAPAATTTTTTTTATVSAKAKAKAAAVEVEPHSGPGLEFVGSTIAGGTGSPWLREQLYEKRSDAQALHEEEERAKTKRTITGILIGVGLASLAATASLLMANSGGGVPSTSQARQAIEGAAGPRGGGAAVVWKVGFR